MILSTFLFLVAAEGFDLGPVNINGRGYIQNDFRLVLERRDNGEVPGQYIRNEASVFGQLNVSVGDHVSGVVTMRPVFYGIATITQFSDLLDRQKNDPFFLEFDNGYLEVSDFIVRGLDLRIGRQVVVWGTGDLFNPTNNLNPRDFYDPLLFGKSMGTEMIKVKYATPFDLSIEAIYEPVFRPARLPTEAPAAFDTSGVPVANASDAAAFDRLRAFQNSFSAYGTITNSYDLHPLMPSPTFGNGNAAVKVAGHVLSTDFSFSYLYGRWDLPVANAVQPDLTLGTGTVSNVSHVNLVYPRMHVLGADMSTSIDKLGGLGLWAELAVVIPQAENLVFTAPPLLTAIYGATPCPASAPCPVVRSTPFPKLTVGTDYTFTKWLYVNLQYLYGFVDEFGIDFLHSYLVGDVDFKPFGEDYLLRLAGVVNLNDGSVVAYPEITVKAYSGVAIDIGALIFAGAKNTKFWNPDVGSTQLFLRGRLSF
jgi:hypothetical protein